MIPKIAQLLQCIYWFRTTLLLSPLGWTFSCTGPVSV